MNTAERTLSAGIATLDLGWPAVKQLAAQILGDMGANVFGVKENLGVSIATLLESRMAHSRDSRLAMAAQLGMKVLVPGSSR